MLVTSWSLLPSLPSRVRSTLCIYSQEKHMCAGTTWVCPLCKGRHFHSPGVLQLVAGARRTQVLRPSVVGAECVTVHWMQISVVIIIIFLKLEVPLWTNFPFPP